MTTELSEMPEFPLLFFPHELSANGTPSPEAIRRTCPIENDDRTEEELKSVARFFRLFDIVFTAQAEAKYEESVRKRTKERLANRRKYVRREAKRMEGGE